MDKNVMDMVKKLQEIRIDLQNDQLKLGDSINDSLKAVDELQHLLPDDFDLTTAIALCKAGYFVQYVDSSSKESMHYYDANLYFEDGTTVTVSYLKENNMGDHWRVKKNPLEIDLTKLRDMHHNNQGVMLDGGSYEDCFK